MDKDDFFRDEARMLGVEVSRVVNGPGKNPRLDARGLDSGFLRKEMVMSKILCATDSTEASRKAEEVAARLAKALEAELWYVYVSPVEPEQIGGPFDMTVLEEVQAREHEVLRYAEELTRKDGTASQFVLVRSHKVVSAIVQVAEEHGADFIVLGSTGRSGIPKFVVGSTASGVLHKAHCTVIVAR